MKAAPPWAATWVRNAHIFPSPTAAPDAAKINPNLIERCPVM